MKCLASLTEASTRKNSAEFYPCISEYMPKNSLKKIKNGNNKRKEKGDTC